MAFYTGRSGKIYSLEKQIASGGEGIVYSISGSTDQVAKIYKDGHFATENERSTMERKLKTMLSFNISPVIEGRLRLAWPQDILYDRGRMIGFIMPAVRSKMKIFDICRTGKNGIRYQVYPNYSWQHSVQYAYLLAWVVDYVHRNGVIIGDMNPNNIIIDADHATVTLIDCDSFDITDPVTKEHFPCTVGLPEVLAPEIQGSGKMIKDSTFSEASDNFSLAIHLFRMLMNNESPFGGVNKDMGSDSKSMSQIDVNADIINGECPYVRSCKYEVRSTSPQLSMLPDSLVLLFIRTFRYKATTVGVQASKRATASEWRTALYPYIFKGTNLLKVCHNNTYGGPHIYPATNSTCPWCELERRQKAAIQQMNQQNTPPPVVVQQNPPAVVRKTPPTIVQQNLPVSTRHNLPVWPYYVVMIACGIMSGFIFGDSMRAQMEFFGQLRLPTAVYTIVISVLGAFFGYGFGATSDEDYHKDGIYGRKFFWSIFCILFPAFIVEILALAATLVIWLGSLIFFR